MSSMNVDCFRYLVLGGNFLNFRLCEIQLGAQCLLGEHGPLRTLLPQKLMKVLIKNPQNTGADMLLIARPPLPNVSLGLLAV